MKTLRNAPPGEPRQDTPEDLVARLLYTIRGQFCSDLDPKAWHQSTSFIRRNVILWPARFMKSKGFTLPPARYEAIMREIFGEIKRHGRPDLVKFWPGYLMKCVQDHWHHHWEDYYAEAKAVRGLAERALLACQAAVPAEDRTVESLAMAHRVLTKRHKAKKRPVQSRQLGLF